MREFEGLRIYFNPHVPRGTMFLLGGDGILFRDKYDLMSAIFWGRVGPILERLADEAAREWARIGQ